MNLGDLAGSIPFVGQILPILKVLGLDKQVTNLERDQIGKRLEAGVPAVVKRLESDGITPASKAVAPETERFFIRAALYLSLKEAFRHILPGGKGANLAADFVRDQHDDQVVAIVSPQMDEQTTTEQAVRQVNAAFLDRAF